MTSVTLSEMRTCYEGRVQEPDIDNLGHMNVRVYARKAAEATHVLAAGLGLEKDALEQDGAVLHILDGHTRFYREQLEGAPLEISGGVLEASPDVIALYLEMINAENGDLAATFRNVITLHDATSRERRAFEAGVLSASNDLIVDWPERGQPRSLPLETWTPHVNLAAVDATGLPRRMEPQKLSAEDCDSHGYLDLSGGELLAFYRMPIKWHKPDPDFVPASGEKRGIATVESRQVIFAIPRLGDSLVTHSVIVDVGAKKMQFRHWTFNGDTGEPFSVLAQIGLGFDLDARRASDFPPKMRAKLEENAHPEFT